MNLNIYNRKLFAARGMLYNGGGGGTPPVTPPATPPVVTPPVLDDDDDEDDKGKDIEKIRRRMSGYRLKAKELEDKLTAEQAARDAAIKTATDATKAEVKKEADERLLRAEVRAALKAENVIDASDAMKLLDLSALKLDENGEVIGLDDLIKKAKEGKAYLFKAASTSHEGRPPKPGDAKAKTASEMTDAEADAELAQLIKRR